MRAQSSTSATNKNARCDFAAPGAIPQFQFPECTDLSTPVKARLVSRPRAARTGTVPHTVLSLGPLQNAEFGKVPDRRRSADALQFQVVFTAAGDAEPLVAERALMQTLLREQIDVPVHEQLIVELYSK